jgi:hypothetical protein
LKDLKDVNIKFFDLKMFQRKTSFNCLNVKLKMISLGRLKRKEKKVIFRNRKKTQRSFKKIFRCLHRMDREREREREHEKERDRERDMTDKELEGG